MMQAKGKTGKIRLTGHLDVPADRFAGIRAALPEHIRLTRAEPGCEVFEVTPSPRDPARLTAGIERHDRIEELPA